MEEVLNPTKLSYIDETIFVSAILCYTIWRIKNRFNVVKLFKLHLRECAIFLLFTSVLMSFVYNLSVAFLNNIYEIDKYYLEKIGHLEGVHNVMIFNRMIDMIWVMNYTFNISAMLKMSAMFMLISLWSPCVKAFLRNENMFANDSEANFKDLDIYTSKSVSQASIITFATLYSFIRIPISFILDLNWEYAPEKTMIFYRSVFYGSEMYLAVLFFLILETRFLSQNSKKPVQLVNLLIIIMTLDALIRYYINIINIPVEFNSVTVHVLNKVGFLSQMGIYMLMINFLCPLETQLYEAKQSSPKLYLDTKPKLQFDNDNSIVLAKDINNEYSRPSIIEFGEYKSELMHSK